MERDDDMTDRLPELIAAAQDALTKAYAPYSGHPVGAALLASDGNIYSGCNVENAAYPLGACAEAGAIGGMVMAGARRIEHVVIVGPGEKACTPCGGCRQKIYEFAADSAVPVTVCSVGGTVLLETDIKTLLPHAFGPSNVQEMSE